MKKIILLISLSLVFTQELKVEGDLRVNGVVLNTKVDSLEFVIDSLQIQVDSLKNLQFVQQSQISSQQTLIEQLQAQIMQLGSQLGLVDCNGVFGGDAVEDVCGICDNNSSNDGSFDNCGICDNDSSNDCLQDCAGNWGGSLELDACGDCGGASIDEDECIITDYNGNTYETIWIGQQHWMAENLRTWYYMDGELVPTNQSSVYNNGSSDEYHHLGALYSYYAVVDNDQICPEGWHIPTIEEVEYLMEYLGGNEVAGAKMKSTISSSIDGYGGWDSPNMEYSTNESGFNAKPGGYYNFQYNAYDRKNKNGYFWTQTSSDNVDFAFMFRLDYDNSYLNIQTFSSYNRLSIRCIQD
ncbi:MAG: hypothetical protein CMF96_05000 [Candidatus Marinimicrobia bacterium]|nr:hypothetical protein [Candidatus Neomarinimicrobiota bacterium]